MSNLKFGLSKFWSVSCAALLMASAFSGCQTPRYKEFENAKVGMEKDQVLSATGGPYTSRRWKGKDRWIYEFKGTPEGSQTREVHFENGKAVYVGMKVVPAVSGEEQDRMNEESNAAEEQKLAAERKAWEAHHGVYHSQFAGKAGQGAPPLDRFDRQFNESTYGIQDDNAERAKLAPTYQSVD